MQAKKVTYLRHLLIIFFLLIGTFLIYKFIYPSPRNWYDHYFSLARSFMAGRVDTPSLPEFYHDVIKISGKNYLPFPPGPSITLVPFMVIFPGITQQTVSIILGAVNVGLIYLLLAKFTKTKNAVLLSLFYAFGTVAFWSSVVGTTWYFGHTTAIFYLLLALHCFYSKRDFSAGIFFALAVLCRYPVFLGIIFFVLSLYNQPKRLLSFLGGGTLLVPLQLYYSYARFGNIFKTGYYEVYRQYLSTSFPQTIMQIIKPNLPVFGYMDIRNIPLHLYTAIFMPPNFISGKLVPSPYGMGIIFTSPLLLLAFKSFKKKADVLLLLGALAIASVDFLHYMQGWVQFGYRFILDFLPFLMILLAKRFKPNKLNLGLLIFSVLVNFWGVLQAIKLGW